MHSPLPTPPQPPMTSTALHPANGWVLGLLCCCGRDGVSGCGCSIWLLSCCRCREALTYLVHAYQSNRKLLKNGKKRGVDETLIAHYRRKCLLELNGNAASLFESGEEAEVAEALSIMSDLVIPCMHLIATSEISKEDLVAVEMMRNHWCSYLGADIDARLQEKLTEFLPKLLDCSVEVRILREPPRIRPNSPHDLCNRFAAVMESIHGNSPVTVT
uniref:Ubiquitin carboxyl-terminal hydrolase 28-like n=1 Tax=Callorhinchus milii TaxID=7868 RepID=A0A4W3H204_CALMI|eukprot:gi/632990194/ref/XP_007884054.1/ PREDICTED: ubiquitin carboxyl-terminal hydrolase 28-like [Callorhinchus milii]